MDKTQHCEMTLASNDSSDIRELIAEFAKAIGFRSVWMTVFNHDGQMMQKLTDDLLGTSTDSFDVHCAPVLRPRGQC